MPALSPGSCRGNRLLEYQSLKGYHRLREKADLQAERRKGVSQGLEAELILLTYGTAKEAAEKGRNQEESELKRPSGAEAHIDFEAFCGTTEVVPFQNSGEHRVLPQPVKPCPFKTPSFSAA
jgi:hypothetical protein